MAARGGWALSGALICFSIFFANVAVGASGGAVFLTDIVEMLTLFAAAVLFVVGVLLREAHAAARDRDTR